jgi:hypothetical protein
LTWGICIRLNARFLEAAWAAHIFWTRTNGPCHLLIVNDG